MTSRFAVPKKDLAVYEAHGIVCLRGVLSPDEVEELRKGMASCVRNPSKYSRWIGGEPPAIGEDPTLQENMRGRLFQDFRCWQDIPEYKKVLTTSALPHVSAQLTRSRTVRLHHDHTLIKEPKTSKRTPWHQDTPYYNVTGDQTISFWIALDPVPKASGMEYIRGSHKWPMMMPRTFKANEAKWFPEGSLPEIPDIENNRDKYDVAGWDVQPGDVLAFHFNMMHAANGSSDIRRALAVRYCGDDVTHAPRAWVTSPPYPELDGNPHELPAGAPLNHKLFPVVYTDTSSRL